MEEAKKIEIITPEGILESVNLITYLISDDGVRQYVVYSKDETIGDGDDRIIYISKLYNKNGVLYITEISDDVEWNEVQKLLRRIANAV
ncbi:MAG: DUF1292 domain-containing protein [Bacilli bacterium]|nr:DUF1292 domain-containing protein [Bacilli bacterium]